MKLREFMVELIEICQKNPDMLDNDVVLQFNSDGNIVDINKDDLMVKYLVDEFTVMSMSNKITNDNKKVMVIKHEF